MVQEIKPMHVSQNQSKWLKEKGFDEIRKTIKKL